MMSSNNTGAVRTNDPRGGALGETHYSAGAQWLLALPRRRTPLCGLDQFQAEEI